MSGGDKALTRDCVAQDTKCRRALCFTTHLGKQATTISNCCVISFGSTPKCPASGKKISRRLCTGACFRDATSTLICSAESGDIPTFRSYKDKWQMGANCATYFGSVYETSEPLANPDQNARECTHTRSSSKAAIS